MRPFTGAASSSTRSRRTERTRARSGWTSMCPRTQPFNCNLTLANSTAEDLTFSVNAQGPIGWTVLANLTGQSQAASAVVKSGASSGVTVSAEPPTRIPAGGFVDVTAQIKPSGDAIAGDYTVALSASGDPSARDSLEIRYTVETSVLWGVVGVALIVAVAAGVWWVFQRYGRR